MADRVPIFDQHGKYAGTLDPDTARCVWEDAGLYDGNGSEMAQLLWRLPDGRYAWREVPMAFYDAPPHRYELVSAGEAVRRVGNRAGGPTDEMLDDAEREWRESNPPPNNTKQTARSAPNLITVWERTTRQEYRIDAEPKWGPIEYGDDWNGLEGFYNFANIERVIRRGKRFILLYERTHWEAPFSDEGAEFLSDQAAVDWIVRNGFDAPADVAHLATIRSVDEVTDEEIEAARQGEAANVLTPDEELELLFPSGASNEQTDPPESEAVEAREAAPVQAAAVEPAPSSKATVEPARKRKRQRRKLPTETEMTPLQATTVHIVGECKGNIAEAAKRLGKHRSTVDETYKAAMAKAGKKVAKLANHKTIHHRQDQRGQTDVGADDDRRHA